MPKFFLNYGGPGGKWSSFTDSDIRNLQQACQNFYGMPHREIHYQIHGVTVSVMTYGIHRALLLEIPRDASQAILNHFKLACIKAEHICQENYSVLNRNCVTAVAQTLHQLDSKITEENVVWPWTLDANLKKYYEYYYPESSMQGQFIAKYNEIAGREYFSLGKERHWEKNIDSPDDIIQQAYSKNTGTGERTKSSLIELGWVAEDENKILRPTDKAPLEFRKNLEAFNQDFEKMLNLKELYTKHANVLSLNAMHFFKDNPSYDTAISRLTEQAKNNPKGASAKVLETIKPKKDEEEAEGGSSHPHL
jgi:hypothetical protein